MTTWEALLAFAGGSGLTALIAFVRWYIEHRTKLAKEARDNRIPDLLAEVHDVYSSLHTIERLLPCDRVLVLKLTNGGAIPRLGSKLYATILYEVHSKHLPAKAQDWDHREIDEEYTELMVRVARERRVRIFTDTLKPSTLKTIYQADGVVEALVVQLCATPGAFYYLSLNYKTHPTLPPADRALKDAQIERLRTLFTRHYARKDGS